MSRILLFLGLAVPLALRAADDPGPLLESIRQKAVAQISRSSNYGCVETIDRSYFRSINPILPSCHATANLLPRKEIMHDRLRLDLAVSQNAEIYSWHGENRFSSSAVSDIVKGGPISSGSFVGYLRNIFLAKDVQFEFRGKGTQDGVPAVKFHYLVPRTVSTYRVKGESASAIVPFHGDFWANAATDELLDLTAIGDDIPFGVDICSAESEVHYQLADISGSKTLIPASFDLRMDDDTHLYTVSRAQYSQCHEFRAQSSLRFDVTDDKAGSTLRAQERTLPLGLHLQIALQSVVDDKTAFTGDSVEGSLTAPVRLSDGSSIPAGASVHGIITQLESYHLEPAYFFLRIIFDRIVAGNQTWQMRTVHQPSASETSHVSDLYRGTPPKEIVNEVRQGTFVIPGKHFRLNRHLHGNWQTIS